MREDNVSAAAAPSGSHRCLCAGRLRWVTPMRFSQQVARRFRCRMTRPPVTPFATAHATATKTPDRQRPRPRPILASSHAEHPTRPDDGHLRGHAAEFDPDVSPDDDGLDPAGRLGTPRSATTVSSPRVVNRPAAPVTTPKKARRATTKKKAKAAAARSAPPVFRTALRPSVRLGLLARKPVLASRPPLRSRCSRPRRSCWPRPGPAGSSWPCPPDAF